MSLFTTLLYQPIVNLLVALYNIAPAGGVGVAILLTTVVIKAITLPLQWKTMTAQRELQEVQPKIEEIRERLKDDKEAMAKELMSVYRVHKVNPFASCLPTIIQMFVFLALYRALSAGLGNIDAALLYSFVTHPGELSHMFLGIDLRVPSIILAVIAAAAQYVQVKQMVRTRPPAVVRAKEGARDEDMTAMMNRTMVVMLPLMILGLGATTIPAGLTLYILVNTVLTWALYHVTRHHRVPTAPAVSS